MKYKSLPIVPAHIIKIWVSTYYPILNMTCVYFFNEKDDDETDFLFNQTFLNLEIERNFFSDCCVLQKKNISWYAISLRLIHEWENFYMKIIDMSLKGIHLPQLMYLLPILVERKTIVLGIIGGIPISQLAYLQFMNQQVFPQHREKFSFSH